MPRRVEDILPNNNRSIRSVPVERPGEPVEPRPSPKKRALRSSDISDVRTSKPSERLLEKPIERTAAARPAREASEEQIIRDERIPLRRTAVTPPPPVRKTSSRARGKRTAFVLIVIGIIVVIGGAGYIASAFFSKATFTLVPKTIPVTVNGTYIATNSTGSMPSGNIAYELITVHGSASTTVAAADGAPVSAKAQGKVTIYNGYSADVQKLIAGTRLSDDTGRVYRLTSTVVIPGFTKPGASVLPGSVSAVVSADQAGPSYNISKSDNVSDFKIVAYKGTPKYDAMYARLASDVTGGSSGTQKIVNPAVLASTTETLRMSLGASLKDQVARILPKDYVMYDNGFVASFSPAETGGVQGSQAAVSVAGTGYGVIFKRADLVKTVVGDKNASQFGDFSYTSPGIDSLDFTIANPKDFSPEKKSNLIMHLAGSMKLVGSIPVDDLKQRLAGAPLASTQDVLKRYKDVIESGSGELVPPWTTIPKDMSRISVVIKDR